jgi:tetratricopeptide (TPR) repeat protein
MNASLEARQLISQGRLREAGTLLDSALGKAPDNDDLWYLRGVVSLKLNNHENAHECLERALTYSQKALYHKTIGMAHLEMYEVEDAVGAFAHAVEKDPKDAESHFLLAICLILLDDPRAKEHMEKAYLRNRKKTQELLRSFVDNFFVRDPTVRAAVKKELMEKVEKMK